jgi:hypothetical protein
MSAINVVVARVRTFPDRKDGESFSYDDGGKHQSFASEMFQYCGTDIVFEDYTSISQFLRYMDSSRSGLGADNDYLWVLDWLEDIAICHLENGEITRNS